MERGCAQAQERWELTGSFDNEYRANILIVGLMQK
jgi:hypothetical protein